MTKTPKTLTLSVKKPARASFDSTLEATRGGKDPIDGTDAEQIFKEMKKREF